MVEAQSPKGMINHRPPYLFLTLHTTKRDMEFESIEAEQVKQIITQWSQHNNPYRSILLEVLSCLYPFTESLCLKSASSLSLI